MADVKIRMKDKDENVQIDMTNIIPSRTNQNISDAQKIFRTLNSNDVGNHPKPKSMFIVLFNTESETINRELAFELTKFVKSVTKPNISMVSKSLNQYNKIKYIYTDIKYGDLKITFYDVKDNPVQRAFFNYLKSLAYDFNKHKDDFNDSNFIPNEYKNTNWGLHLLGNNKKITDITVAEPFGDKLMVYTVPNPVFDSITFNDNSAGDYSIGEISVNFKVEGITNDLIYDSAVLENIIGKPFSDIGGEDLVHFLQRRWGEGSGMKSVNPIDKLEVTSAPVIQAIEQENKIQNQIEETQNKKDRALYTQILIDSPYVGSITDAFADDLKNELETTSNATSVVFNSNAITKLPKNSSAFITQGTTSGLGFKYASINNALNDAIEQPSSLYIKPKI